MRRGHPREEHLDLVEQAVRVPCEEQVIAAVELDDRRVRNVFGQIAGVLDAAEHVAAPVEYERWHAQRGQDGTDVASRQVSPVACRTLRRVREALTASPPRPKTGIVERARREHVEIAPAAVMVDVRRRPGIERVDSHTRGIVGLAQKLGEAVQQQQARDPFRVCRCIEHGEERAREPSHDRRPLHPDRVHHEPKIVRPRLDGRCGRLRISSGRTPTTAVE